MTCQDLASLPAERSAEAEAHMATCPGCRALAQSIDGIKRMPVPQSLFSPEVIAPVRPMPTRVWFIAVAFALPIALAALGVWWKGALGWDALPSEPAALFTVLAAAGLAALVLGFYRQFKPGARDSIDGRAAMAILLAGFIGWTLVEFAWHPAAGFEWAGAWRCFRFGTIVAVGASLALLGWARQGFAPNPRSASFWTGALASMAGMIALAIHCPNLEVSHLLMGHATVILVASYLVAAIGRRFFGLR